MRIVVKSLLSSLPYMRNVLTVGGLILLIFAIMAVNLFKGQFYSCQPTDIIDQDRIISEVFTKDDCINLGGEWINAK